MICVLKMRLVSFFFVFQLFCCLNEAWKTFGCTEMRETSRSLSYNTNSRSKSGICWLIRQPGEGDDYFTNINFTRLAMPSDCNRFYVTVTTIANETHRFCNGDEGTVNVVGSVKIQLIYEDIHSNAATSYLDFNYETVRSIFAVEDVNKTREYLISDLHDQGYTAEGWGEDTHRVMTALHLASATDYAGENERITQLGFHISSVLLRNYTHPLSVNELSMIVNSLTATCQDPRQFYDQNLLQILEERAASSIIPNPNAILSICVAGRELQRDLVDKIFYRLMQDLSHGFSNDHKAMSLMALSCVKKRSNNFEDNPYASQFYNATIESFIQEQRPDGSFGNAYTTALVTQALIATGQLNNSEWKLSSTIRFLLKQVNCSEADLQLRSLVLPILNGKSLVDLGEIDCSNRSRGNKDDIKMTPVFYSLLVGEQRKLIKIIGVLVPANSSAYSVMKKAELTDPAFKFESIRMGNSLYIYKINDIANDFQSGKIWMLYTMRAFPNETLIPQNISADKLLMRPFERLVMWYKTVDI